MKRKDITYKHFQSYIKDKDAAVNHYIDNYLCKCQSMFTYTGLPDSIPQAELERILQTAGNCFITKVDGELYALQGSTGGPLDAYYRPTQYVVANPALNLSKVYHIGTDGILWKNDYSMNGLLPLIGKFAVLLTDANISLNLATVLSRIPMVMSAPDDKTKTAADLFVQKITDGEFSIIGENAFFDGVKLQNTNSKGQDITQLVELIQYYKANLLNELGLEANYNMKRERLNAGEVAMNIDALLPFVDDMLYERQRAVTAVNEMFGMVINVDLSSSWKTTHEENDQLEATVETPPTISVESRKWSDNEPIPNDKQDDTGEDTEDKDKQEGEDEI